MPDQACILCSNRGAIPERTISAAELVAVWKDRLEIDVHGYFLNSGSISLFRCPVCGLGFFAPQISGSEEFYAALQKHDWYYMPEKWEYEAALDDLQTGDRVLELGCGWGEFIIKAMASGFAIEGIELSSSAVAVAAGNGLPVKKEDLYDRVGKEKESYEAICFFQVLEHVPEPKRFIAACTDLLRVGGSLIVSVPNNDAFIRNDPEGWLNMPPHHVSRWSQRSLEYLETLFPLRLLRLAFEPLADYHLPWYIDIQQKRLSSLSHVGRLGQRSLGVLFDKVISPLGMYRYIRGHTVYACFQKIET